MSRTRSSKACSAVVASCLVVLPACNDGTPEAASDAIASETAASEGDDTAASGQVAVPPDAQEYKGCGGPNPFEIGQLELIPIELIEDIWIQRLSEPTELGEDIIVHFRIPQPPELEKEPSLVTVVGVEEAPVLLFSSDALQQVGRIEQSPGEGFFSTFASSDDFGIEQRVQLEQQILDTEEIDEVSLVIQGRHPIAVSTAQAFQHEAFFAGELVGLGRVRITPRSVEANWHETVAITDPQVVQDSNRTYDTCSREGNACGPWTFCHFMTEMANESLTGITPEDFTKQWLEQWLSTYDVNEDSVDSRAAMQSLVIDPWLAASGGEQLDLGQSPFRLLAIMNRLDLRTETTGGGGYFGGGGTTPANAGELRFVFGVMAPKGDGTACEPLPFTVIFEYGVPKSGCSEVRDWANQWVALDSMGGFGGAYNDALEQLTEPVVQRGAMPSRGNGSAINQIRTNERALGADWELREFALTTQTYGCSPSDTPSNGFLRPHTVAQTPDDRAFTPTPDPIIDAFVATGVMPTVSVSPQCSSAHEVPMELGCGGKPVPLLGGNALAAQNGNGSPPGTWHASGPSTPEFICGRHQFSVNTCNGCHTCDTATSFTHVDNEAGIPARLSGFLLGETVDDTQFAGVSWNFADLDRRYQDLYAVAGAACFPVIPSHGDIFVEIGLNPFDPIIDFGIFEQLLDIRTQFANPELTLEPMLGDIGRGPPPVH